MFPWQDETPSRTSFVGEANENEAVQTFVSSSSAGQLCFLFYMDNNRVDTWS